MVITVAAQPLQGLVVPQLIDPNRDPEAAGQALGPQVRVLLPAVLHSGQRLKQGAISALHLVGAFVPHPNLPDTPEGFVVPGDPRWYNALYATLGIIGAIDTTAVSYQSENTGALFQHLTKHPGSGRDAQKSHSRLRGHTDAAYHALPNENRPRFSASPDLVVLIGIRNPDTIATRVYALNELLRPPYLTFREIQSLKSFAFDVEPQDSFDFPPGTIEHGLPVLIDDPLRGPCIRYSNSKISADDQLYKNEHAVLLKLQHILTTPPSGLLHEVVVSPGDILLINNRVALHGRDAPGPGPTGGTTRWLIRTYAVFDDTRPIVRSQVPFALLP